jgi:hypothetical protein
VSCEVCSCTFTTWVAPPFCCFTAIIILKLCHSHNKFIPLCQHPVSPPDAHTCPCNLPANLALLALTLPSQEHWFAIRQVDGEWWNFNSLYPAPEHLSAFYLTAYLDSLKQQGYTIFVVRGQLPDSPASTGAELDGPGKWWSPDEVRGARAAAFLSAMAAAVAWGDCLCCT